VGERVLLYRILLYNSCIWLHFLGGRTAPAGVIRFGGYCTNVRYYGGLHLPSGDKMTIPEIISIVVSSAIAIIVGGYFGGAKAREEIKKLSAEREKSEQESINQRVEREQRLNEIIEAQDAKIAAITKSNADLAESNAVLVEDMRRTKILIVTLEKQLLEREELVQDFRDYVEKLVIIMRAAALDVPQFQPRRKQ